MVSFLFHSKGNAPFVNQKSIIQNHLFLMMLLEKMRDMALSTVILGIRWPGGHSCRIGGPTVGTGEVQPGLLQPDLRVGEGGTELPVSPFRCSFTHVLPHAALRAV